MMSQDASLKFLQKNGVDVTHLNYNLVNDLIAIADKIAEEEFKRVLLVLCKTYIKGGEE